MVTTQLISEESLALYSGGPAILTGRVAFSLQLLVELKRPVFDLLGEQLVTGWQADDLPAVIDAQEENLADRGGLTRAPLGTSGHPRR